MYICVMIQSLSDQSKLESMEKFEDSESYSATFIENTETEPSCMLINKIANHCQDQDQQLQVTLTANRKIEEADEILEALTEKGSELLELLRARESQKDSLIGIAKQGERCGLAFREAVVPKYERMDSLKLALDKLSFANKAWKAKARKSCSLDEEINCSNVHTLLLHGSRSLAAEKQVLRDTKRSKKHLAEVDPCSKLECLNNRIQWLSTESYQETYDQAKRCWYFDKNRHKLQLKQLKQLKCEREDVIAYASTKGAIWKSLGSKDRIKKQIHDIEKELEDPRGRHLAYRPTLKDTGKLMKAIEKDINTLRTQLREATLRKEHVYEFILKHQEQNKDNKSSCFCEHISVLKIGGEHSKQKGAAHPHQDLFHGEVEKFMSKRQNNEDLKDGYFQYLNSSVCNFYY